MAFKFKLPNLFPKPKTDVALPPISPREIGSEAKPSVSPSPAVPKENPAQALARGMLNVADIIAPSAIEIDFDYIKIGTTFFRTFFISGYPRFVGANWLSPLINFDHTLELSMFYYPIQAQGILDDLRHKIAEMEATMSSDSEHGKVLDPAVKAALEDAKGLQDQLVKGAERFFQFSLYVTIPAKTLEELNSVTKQVEGTLGSIMIISKHATLQMEQAFQTTIPTCLDKILVTRNMDTTSLATTFPFTSSELTSNEGILYGINKHNGSLVIFDRFTLENPNSVVFAKAGAGKSYFVKLECLRSLMFGTDVIVIDPENEYQRLCEAVGGEYIEFSAGNPAKINPFDLSQVSDSGEDELGLKILSLHSLFKIIYGQINNAEEAVLDRSLIDVYKLKGITRDPETQKANEPPLMEDLYKVLLGREEPEAKGLATRLERYIKGSVAGIFDQRSNINLDNGFTVFSTRQLEDVLRPIAIFMILDYIWTKVKRELKKRILVVDEAWYMMQNPDSASFMYSIAKRSRKYYLGLTTITQNVGDFLGTDFGQAIISNSSLQVLLKQHPSEIDKLGEVFYLSDGEKRFLLAAGVGEGLFFAGSNHVAIQAVASPEEHKLITTKPSEVLQMREEDERKAAARLGQQLTDSNKPEQVIFKPETNNLTTPATESPAEQQVTKII